MHLSLARRKARTTQQHQLPHVQGSDTDSEEDSGDEYPGKSGRREGGREGGEREEGGRGEGAVAEKESHDLNSQNKFRRHRQSKIFKCMQKLFSQCKWPNKSCNTNQYLTP